MTNIRVRTMTLSRILWLGVNLELLNEALPSHLRNLGSTNKSDKSTSKLIIVNPTANKSTAA